MDRRNFLKSTASGLFLMAAPAIVRSESLMVLPRRKVIYLIAEDVDLDYWYDHVITIDLIYERPAENFKLTDYTYGASFNLAYSQNPSMAKNHGQD